MRFTDESKNTLSQRRRVYRLLKAHDLITSPAYIVIKAAEAFKDKEPRNAQPALADRLHLSQDHGLGLVLSLHHRVGRLPRPLRRVVAWKLCATMKAKDVTATLDLALAASGLDQMTVVHRPRLLSDNGASYVAADLAQWLDRQEMEHVRSAPYHPPDPGQD